MSAYLPLLAPFAFVWTTYMAIKDDAPEGAMTQIIGIGISVWLLVKFWSIP